MNLENLVAMLIPDIVTEADDITKQVNDIMGGDKAPAEAESGDQREEDLTQTDDLFDNINKDSSEDNPVDNPQNNSKSKNESSDDDSNDDDDTDADNQDSESEPSDSEGDEEPTDTADDTTPNDEDSEMSEDDTSVFSDKNSLKENMVYFFNIIRYTIKSLEDSLSSTDNQETIRVINSVIQNLYNAKNVLYKILTEQMESTSYEILTSKYITIKRIYDISCDMLEEHFANHPNNRVKYKRFRNKTK